MAREPDTFEKSVRFGRGALFGFVVVLFLVLRWGGQDWLTCLGIAGGAAIAFGLLAMIGGDEFWSTLLGWLRWW